MPGILYNKTRFADAPQVKEMTDLLKLETKGKFVYYFLSPGFDVLLSNDRSGYDELLITLLSLQDRFPGSCLVEQRNA